MENRFVRELIEEVLTVCRWDDTGVTLDLVEPAFRAAVEIGMTKEDIERLANEIESRGE